MQRLITKRGTLFVAGLLAATTLATFWPVLRHPFISYDDPVYVTGNPHVQVGLTGRGLVWAFRTGEASNWHPLTWLSHELDAQLFGLKPAGHHFTSLLFHLANTLLLFFLLKRMTNHLWPSAFVAALFALHPLHVESVAWVAERKDVLSTFFGLLCLIGYVRYVEAREAEESKVQSPKPKVARIVATDKPLAVSHISRFTFHVSRITHHASFHYALALFFFALGLMSKPMLVTVPFVLLLLDFWPLCRFRLNTEHWILNTFRRLLLEKLPFLCLAAASTLITMRVQSQGGAVSSIADLPLTVRVPNAITSCLKYLGKTVWPTDLAVYYPHPMLDHSQWPAWQTVAGGLVLTGISALAILRLKRQPWIAVGWFWFLGTLLPVIGLVQAGSQAMADRYTYIPLIGIFIIIAWTLPSIVAPKRSEGGSSASASSSSSSSSWPRLSSATAILAIIACVALTRQQLSHWRDDMTLFEHALSVNEKNSPAHTVLGIAYARAGKLGFALVHCRAATRDEPGFAGAWHASGDVYDALHQPQRAIASYQNALRINSGLVESWFRLGCVYAGQDNFAEAIRCYQAALRLDPDFAPAHNNLAQAWWSLGNHDEGLKEFAQAVRLAPASPEKRYNFGLALEEAGKLADAASQFAEAIRLQPDYAPALSALGGVQVRAGNFSDAERWFREIVRRYPNDAGARVNLGGALLRAGHTNQARAAFADARRLDPNLAKKNLEAGRSLVAQAKVESAAGCFTTAAWLEPDNAEAHRQLGLLLARNGKLVEAVGQLEQAVRLAPGAESHYNLGLALAMQGKLSEAVAHYEQTLNLRPDSPAALNDLAWIRATSPRVELRDGPGAVRLAERACQLNGGGNAPFLSTLAAAYAEAGRFADAVKTAETARDLARTAGDKSALEIAESRLALYRAGQPYRQ